MQTGVHKDQKPVQLHRLAAVMFADMMGYTALMQENEQRAKLLRDRQREILQHEVPAHNGKIVQYYGDGALSLFDSAIDAVHAGIKIQLALQQHPRVPLRIGIHSGDVVYDDEGVFGDCVNLASRIEALGAPGSVLISDKVYDEIKNQPDLPTRLLGNFNLKNVKRQVPVYAISTEGLIIPTPEYTGIKAEVKNSIAVLPFINMSADPENEYFSDGISEEILNALTKVEGLYVTARSSSFFFKGKYEDVRQIGSQLGVATILTGSVRKSGKRIRTAAQLVNTTDGNQVWSETYDSDLEDIFQVQDEISSKILDKLKENFKTNQREHVIKAPTDNVEAYNIYLKGRYHWNKGNPEEMQKAIRHFEDAIAVDPNFALPYCALSYCYSMLGSAGTMAPQKAFAYAIENTGKAIELDPNHAESHLSLASIKFFHNWDFEGAEKSLNKALDLCLNSSLINQVHGWFLIAKGEFGKAIEKMEQALLLDPLSLPLIANLADAYGFAGRFEEAHRQYDKAIDMDPNFRRAFEGKGMLYIAAKEYDKAIASLEQYHKLVGHPLKGLSSLGHAYAAAGQLEKAQDCLEKIQQRIQEEPDKVFYMDLAFLYAGLGAYDKTLEYLHKTYEHRHGIACLGMIFCIRFPMLHELRRDERFRNLVEKMNINQYNS